MSSPIEMEEAVQSSPSTLRGLWLVVIGLLLAGPLGAVYVGASSGDARSVALATITASAATVENAKTFTVEMTMTMTTGTNVANEGRPFVMHSSMAYDNELKAGRFTNSYDGAPQVEFDGVFTADRMYFRLPEAGRLGVGGKLWVAAVPSTDASSGSPNPAKTGTDLLQDLAGAKGDVEVKGIEDIGGVRTTHYRVDIDTTDLVERGRRTQERLGVGAPAGPAPEIKITSSPADVWLDDAGRPRRVRMVMTMDIAGSTSVTTTDSRYDYDQPVTVWLPPAEQVHEVSTVADAFKLLVESS